MLNFNPEQTLRVIRERATRQLNRAKSALSWPGMSDLDLGLNLPPTPTLSPTDTQNPTTLSPTESSPNLTQISSPLSFSIDRSQSQSSSGSGSSSTSFGSGSLRGDAALPFRIDDTPLRRNLRSLEQHILDDHYTRYFYPAGAILEGTVTTPILSTPRFAVLSFPNDGTTSAAHFTFARPTQWLDGKIILRIWYSSPTASANIFRLFAQVSTLTTGEVSTAAVLALSTNLDVAGPTVANTLMKTADTYTTLAINRTDELISVRIGRSSGAAEDTNANACHIYAVRAEMALTVQEG